MAFAEDTAPYFAEFGVEVILPSGSHTRGLFDAPYAEQFGIAGASPGVVVREADIGRLQPGEVVAVDGRLYRVRGIEPDGTGFARLALEA